MADPATLAEFEARVQANTRTRTQDGRLVLDVACPFCGAGDFLTVDVMAIRHALAAPITCNECQRSIRSTVEGHAQCTRFEMVQTGGDDPPPYLPRFRRSI